MTVRCSAREDGGVRARWRAACTIAEEEPVSEPETHGPIDFVLIEFPGDNLRGEMAAALLDLVDNGIIRLYDLLVVRKDEDGTFSGVELADLGDDAGGLLVFSGARSGLLGDDDIAEAAAAMEPGTMAALILYENAWAIPFVAAARRAGGQLVASARLSAQEVMDALDAVEAAD
jgi:hypothetical protein